VKTCQLTTKWLFAYSTVAERRSLAVELSLSCARPPVTTIVGKPSATDQPTRPTQPFILTSTRTHVLYGIIQCFVTYHPSCNLEKVRMADRTLGYITERVVSMHCVLAMRLQSGQVADRDGSSISTLKRAAGQGSPKVADRSPEKFCRSCVQICSFWHKTNI